MMHTWTMQGDEVSGDVACALLAPSGQPGDPAEQAMPDLADVFGMEPNPGAHTDRPTKLYVTLSEPGWISLHVGTDRPLRRPVPRPWQQTAHSRGWVHVVIGYQAMATDADIAEYLDDAMVERVTADVLVRV